MSVCLRRRREFAAATIRAKNRVSRLDPVFHRPIVIQFCVAIIVYWSILGKENGPLKIRQKKRFYMEEVHIAEHCKNSYKTPIIMITSHVRYCRWNLLKTVYSFLISFYQFRHECLSRRNNSLHICCHLTFYSKVLQKISVPIWLRLWRASKVWSQPPHLWLHLWRASKVGWKLPAYLTTPLTSFKGIAKRWGIWLHLWRA